MHANAQLIERFYQAFQRRDAAAMSACYHPQVHFSDPVFTDLRGAQAKAMWAMLCARGKDLKLEFRSVQADEQRGSAHWEAWYRFSATGRAVHNIIEARFEFRDGLIIRHQDQFDLKAWSAQALGLMGRLLGGSSFLNTRIRATAAAGLTDWLNKHPRS